MLWSLCSQGSAACYDWSCFVHDRASLRSWRSSCFDTTGGIAPADRSPAADDERPGLPSRGEPVAAAVALAFFSSRQPRCCAGTASGRASLDIRLPVRGRPPIGGEIHELVLRSPRESALRLQRISVSWKASAWPCPPPPWRRSCARRALARPDRGPDSPGGVPPHAGRSMSRRLLHRRDVWLQRLYVLFFHRAR